MSEEILIRQGAPTLAGIKTGSLFPCPCDDREALLNWKAIALAAVLLVLTHWVKFTKNLHPILFILASAAVGVVFGF